MRILFFITSMLAGAVCMGLMPAEAAPQPTLSIAAKAQIRAVENVGWRRRYYRRYGYPHAYYPPAYMATTTRRLPMGITRLCIRRFPTMHPIDTTGRIIRLTTDVQGSRTTAFEFGDSHEGPRRGAVRSGSPFLLR